MGTRRTFAKSTVDYFRDAAILHDSSSETPLFDRVKDLLQLGGVCDSAVGRLHSAETLRVWHAKLNSQAARKEQIRERVHFAELAFRAAGVDMKEDLFETIRHLRIDHQAHQAMRNDIAVLKHKVHPGRGHPRKPVDKPEPSGGWQVVWGPAHARNATSLEIATANLEAANAEVEQLRLEKRRVENSGLGFARTSTGEYLQQAALAQSKLDTEALKKAKDQLAKLQPLSFYEMCRYPETGWEVQTLRPGVAVVARQLVSECRVPEDKIGLAFHLIWAGVFGTVCPEQVPAPQSLRQSLSSHLRTIPM